MRAYDTDFQVDGVPLLAPDAGVELGFTDLDAADAGRDESGVMHRIVVREKVRSFGFSYAWLTGEEFRYLQSLFAGKPTFTFTYRAENDRAASCTAYCSNFSAGLYNRRLGLYRDMKFNIIAC